METSTQLSTVNSIVIPKPTRKEIISALVEVARKEHGDRLEASNKEKSDAKAALDKAVIRHLTKSATAMRLAISGSSMSSYTSSIEVRFTVDLATIPDDIKALHEAEKKADAVWIRSFDEKKVRNEITNRLGGMDSPNVRIAKLAESEEIADLYKHINQSV